MKPSDKALELYNLYYYSFSIKPEEIRRKLAKKAATTTILEISKYSEKYMDTGFWKSTLKEIAKL